MSPQRASVHSCKRRTKKKWQKKSTKMQTNKPPIEDAAASSLELGRKLNHDC